MSKITIEPIELVALKKLALISGALAQSLNDRTAQKEQTTLTRVLIEVINRADLANTLAAREGGAL